MHKNLHVKCKPGGVRGVVNTLFSRTNSVLDFNFACLKFISLKQQSNIRNLTKTTEQKKPSLSYTKIVTNMTKIILL